MALIKCSECGKEISDKADTCPSCGNPLNQDNDVVSNKVETVNTSKRWKKMALWAVAIFIFGWVTLVKSIPLGFFLFFIAFVVLVISRIGAWWTNG